MLQLAQIVLDSNIVTFNEELLIKLVGTAMGTKFAPNYANIYMGDFETEAIKNYPLKPLLWLRFMCSWFGHMDKRN